MDNFRRSPHRKPQHIALDGVVPTARRGGQYGDRTLRPTNMNTPTNTGRLDNFRRHDGFQPASQTITPAAQAHAPVRPVAQLGRQPVRDASGRIHPGSHAAGHATPPKQSKAKKPHRVRRVVLKTFLVIILAGFLTGGYIFGKAFLKTRNIFKGGSDGAAALQENVDPSKLNGEGDGRVNILLLGRGGEGHEAPDLTDTLLVASIDPIQNTAALLSVPRDLYVKPQGYNYMKINSVYASAKNNILADGQSAAAADKAGLTAIEKTVEQTMGIPVHYYVMVDFEAFREAIDAVGGVTVDVKEDLVDATVAWENNNDPVIARAGEQTFDGRKALLFSRSRHGSARGDFDRTERQRAVLLALKEKVLSVGTFSNPVRISQLLDAFGNHVSTNLSIGEMRRLYDIGKSIEASQVASLGLADPPNNFVTTDFIDEQSVVVPRAGLIDYSEIQNFVRNALKDGFLEKESAIITVLNGTNISGIAAKKANELRSFGYDIGEVADAPTKGYEKTVLVDLTGGEKKYTLRYLEQRLGVTGVTQLPDSTIVPGNANFVIILGSDESTSSQN